MVPRAGVDALKDRKTYCFAGNRIPIPPVVKPVTWEKLRKGQNSRSSCPLFLDRLQGLELATGYGFLENSI
jgi:hypothetical protein